MASPWVVTYQIESCGNVTLTEFYRGPRDECARIIAHFTAGEDDLHHTGRWLAIMGPADNWDDYSEGADVVLIAQR